MQVFVDTAALVALGNRRDDWHAAAVAVSRQLTLAGCRFVTTDAVLLEVGNTFSRADYKPIANRLIGTAQRSQSWHCIPVDRGLFDRGFALFRDRADKDWSLTDCTSVVVALDLEIQQVFTTDRHFAQAGLQVLLGDPA
ncbi:MAG: PIN domain-containing protein [Gammaproteobacteria bacterium]|nr:PIN domain-containing protein [Gammaproteobacteria bacterium]